MFSKSISFDLISIHRGHLQTTYRGIPTLKCPFDYVMYQMIIHKIQPDLIVEIGTFMGGASLYMADLLDNNRKGVVHTIDSGSVCHPNVKLHPRIKTYTDGWEGYPLDEAKRYDRVLVIEDSTHTYQNTIDVLRKFESIVTLDSYLIVEDGITDALVEQGVYPYTEFNGGPTRAILEFLTESNDYVIDRSWCDLFGTNATWNPNGYLKRINQTPSQHKSFSII
jgi:cephalosporin hydroxylase